MSSLRVAHTQHIMDLTEALLSLTVGGIMCLTSCVTQVALPASG